MWTRSGQKQGPGNRSLALSLSLPLSSSHVVPRVGSTRIVIAVTSVLPGPQPQARGLPPASLPTSWVQARRCRHALRIPPEKLDPQVPAPGGGSAKPQRCAFSLGGRKGEVGWRVENCARWPSSRRLLLPHIGTPLAASLRVTLGLFELRAPLRPAALSTPASCRARFGQADVFHPLMFFCLSR